MAVVVVILIVLWKAKVNSSLLLHHLVSQEILTIFLKREKVVFGTSKYHSPMTNTFLLKKWFSEILGDFEFL